MQSKDSYPIAQTHAEEIIHGTLDADDLFNSPVGVNEGVAREISGQIRVTQNGKAYDVVGTRFPRVSVNELHDVVLTSGEAIVEINDATSAEHLSIHRLSGSTNLSCGDRTAVIITGHSGHNTFDGFVTSEPYTSPEGKHYTIVIPEGRTTEDPTWVNRVVRIDQVSGFINISKQKQELDIKKSTTIAHAGKIAIESAATPRSDSTF